MNENALILLVEDDQDDSFLLVRALRHAGVLNPIKTASNLCEVFPILEANKPNRAFVIINLSMFVSTGFAILRWMREQSDLLDMPIVAIGNSERESDIQQAFDLGANAYFAKRLDTNELAKLIRELQFFEPGLRRTERNP